MIQLTKYTIFKKKYEVTYKSFKVLIEQDV